MSDMELESLECDAEENIDELETVDKHISPVNHRQSLKEADEWSF